MGVSERRQARGQPEGQVVRDDRGGVTREAGPWGVGRKQRRQRQMVRRVYPVQESEQRITGREDEERERERESPANRGGAEVGRGVAQRAERATSRDIEASTTRSTKR